MHYETENENAFKDLFGFIYKQGDKQQTKVTIRPAKQPLHACMRVDLLLELKYQIEKSEKYIKIVIQNKND